ncbi:hypothetical protein R1flu_009017 [Riccia fluitans]|uniref:Uncharacterized protein n=1 Tax=Riccia fluitans TaxID=41844 RepID=A0ABD1Z0V7_9MARC
MTRFASVFEMWGVLRFVDLRDNLDKKGVGVLENGEHLSFFSAPHDPFWETGGNRVTEGSNSHLLKKESTPDWRKGCTEKIFHPQLYEGARLLEEQHSQPSCQMHIASQGGEEILPLSPLPDSDTESAYLLPTNVLLSSMERFDIPNAHGSLNNTIDSDDNSSVEKLKIPDAYGTEKKTRDSDMKSEPLSLHTSPSNPGDHSDYYNSFPNGSKVLSSPKEPDFCRDSCSTSVSTNNTKLTDLSSPPGSTFDMTFDQLVQKLQTDDGVQHHSFRFCEVPKPRTQYLNDIWSLRNHPSSAQATVELVADSSDDAEWDAFMTDMATKLQDVQDKLDKVMSSAKPDFLVTAQIAMTTLQEGLQQLIAWET